MKNTRQTQMWESLAAAGALPFRPSAAKIDVVTAPATKNGHALLVPDTAIPDRDTCDKCGAAVGNTEDGFTACSNPKCGILYNRALNFAPEWRYYGAEDAQGEDPARCSMPTDPNFEESSNVCVLKYSRGMSQEMRKIQSQLSWTVPYKEKSQYNDFQHIIATANNNGIPRKLTNDAFKFYKQIFDSKNSFRGENRSSIIAASIYIACIVNGCPRTADEIATMFNIGASAATKGCKKAIGIIKLLEKDMEIDDKTVFCTSRPSLFVERYCNRLEVPYDLTMLAEFICLKLEWQNVLPENTPQAIAASVVFFLSSVFGLNITKKMIKERIDLSEVTITKCYKKIAAIQDRLVPASVLERHGVGAGAGAVGASVKA
jgi:transcription initiation factor TFIIIB Brf1 subunit/transcription initiation factor TFIIB